MPRPGVAQPDRLPDYKFRLDEVVCIEGGAAFPVVGEPVVIPVGNTFTLRTELGLDGTLAWMFIGEEYQVTHHWERIEDGATGLLTPSPSAVVPGTGLAHFWNDSGPYTTGNPGATTDLEIPPPKDGVSFASGTFRIVTHVHFHNNNPGEEWDTFAAAFHEGLIIMVLRNIP